MTGLMFVRVARVYISLYMASYINPRRQDHHHLQKKLFDHHHIQKKLCDHHHHASSLIALRFPFGFTSVDDDAPHVE